MSEIDWSTVRGIVSALFIILLVLKLLLKMIGTTLVDAFKDFVIFIFGKEDK